MSDAADRRPGTLPGVLPQRLQAGEPGWCARADVVVVGSGIAGLTAALRLRERAGKVLVVTKGGPAVASDLEPTA